MSRRILILGAGLFLLAGLASGSTDANATKRGSPNITEGKSASVILAADDEWTPPGIARIADVETAVAVVLDRITQSITRQKLTIKLPRVTTLSYLTECFDTPFARYLIRRQSAQPPQLDIGDCGPYKEAMDEVREHIPEAARPNGTIGVFTHSYIQSPAGSDEPFGKMEPVRVHSVAFGSVPVTATVHISQRRVNGQIQPINLKWYTPMTYVPEGVEISGYGPSPGYPYNFTPAVETTGEVVIRLSDVVVDDVPLHVGQNCSAPGTINFHPKAGYYSQNEDPQKGEPGEWQPLGALSYLPGAVDIDAFGGCGSETEDLNPLLTNMISGSGNELDTTQISSAFVAWCDTFYNPLIDETITAGSVWCKVKDAPVIPDESAEKRRMALSQKNSANARTRSVATTPETLIESLPKSERDELTRSQRKEMVKQMHHWAKPMFTPSK